MYVKLEIDHNREREVIPQIGTLEITQKDKHIDNTNKYALLKFGTKIIYKNTKSLFLWIL